MEHSALGSTSLLTTYVGEQGGAALKVCYMCTWVQFIW